jgi:hypothetical protein
MPATPAAGAAERTTGPAAPGGPQAAPLPADAREDPPAIPLSGTPDKPGRPVPGKDPRSRTIERQAAGLTRMAAAIRRRCEHPEEGADPGPFNPEPALEAVWAAREELGECAAALVDALRDRGYSWAQIGDLTSMARQSAHERWGPRHDRERTGAA